jgi:hypothetical protein
VPVYGINIGGYRGTALDPSVKNRYEFTGLNDASVSQIMALEVGVNQRWPWES